MKRQTDISDMSGGLISFDRRRLRRFIDKLDALLPKELKAPEGTLSIEIFNDSDLAKIHAQFLDDPAETDVITFGGDSEDSFAGEICASAERALKCAKNYSSTPSRELCLYIAHGYLHLAGLDDVSCDDAAAMRKAEALAMEILDKNFKKPIFKYNA